MEYATLVIAILIGVLGNNISSLLDDSYSVVSMFRSLVNGIFYGLLGWGAANVYMDLFVESKRNISAISYQIIFSGFFGFFGDKMMTLIFSKLKR